MAKKVGKKTAKKADGGSDRVRYDDLSQKDRASMREDLVGQLLKMHGTEGSKAEQANLRAKLRRIDPEWRDSSSAYKHFLREQASQEKPAKTAKAAKKTSKKAGKKTAKKTARAADSGGDAASATNE
jgi:hypothetical protein